MAEHKKVAIVMAGGFGVTFWPRSTENRPKQFMHIMGEGTMLQNTVTRLRRTFDNGDIYIVTFENFKDIVISQIPDLLQSNIIAEPFGRHTAPATGLALAHLKDKYSDDDIFCIFPSDHIISNVREFNLSLETAISAAEDTSGIITIGIEATRPETQFGYIQIRSNSLDDDLLQKGLRKVSTFAEKPDKNTAKRFIESGDFLWNSGIFILRKGVLQHSFNKFLPETAEAFNYLADNLNSNDYNDKLKKVYMRLNSISLDYGILEKSDDVYCIESSFSWSDMETWDELYRLSMKDAKENVIEGDVVSLKSKRNLILSNGKIIGLYGVDDLIVIDSDDAMLICKRGESDKVREIIDYMRRKNINKY